MFTIEGKIATAVREGHHGEYLKIKGKLSIDGKETPTQVEIHNLKSEEAIERVHNLHQDAHVRILFEEI